MNLEVILFLGGQLVTGVSVYAAIRADLRELMVRVGYAEARLKALESRP